MVYMWIYILVIFIIKHESTSDWLADEHNDKYEEEFIISPAYQFYYCIITPYHYSTVLSWIITHYRYYETQWFIQNYKTLIYYGQLFYTLICTHSKPLGLSLS